MDSLPSSLFFPTHDRKTKKPHQLPKKWTHRNEMKQFGIFLMRKNQNPTKMGRSLNIRRRKQSMKHLTIINIKKKNKLDSKSVNPIRCKSPLPTFAIQRKTTCKSHHLHLPRLGLKHDSNSAKSTWFFDHISHQTGKPAGNSWKL